MSETQQVHSEEDFQMVDFQMDFQVDKPLDAQTATTESDAGSERASEQGAPGKSLAAQSNLPRWPPLLCCGWGRARAGRPRPGLPSHPPAAAAQHRTG